MGRELFGSRPSQGAADGDEIVRDDAEAYPTLHAGIALVAAAVEAMSALDPRIVLMSTPARSR